MVEALRCCFQQGHQVDENLDNTQAPTCHQPLLIALSILGIIGLIIAGTGFAGFGAHQNWWAAGGLSNLSQIDGIIMMAVGGVATLFSLGMIAGFRVTPKKFQVPEYPEIGKEAIAFARQKLREFPDTEPAQIDVKDTHLHCTEEILKLLTLCSQFESRFNVFVEKYQLSDFQWDNDDFFEIAENLIKISYTINYLSLEAIKQKSEGLEKESYNQLVVKVLNCNDLRQLYGLLPSYYLLVRCCAAPFDHNQNRPQLDLIAQEYVIPFYQNGSHQSRWRTLYNDYCDQFRLFLSAIDSNTLIEPKKAMETLCVRDEKLEEFHKRILASEYSLAFE